jgi:hypothetical protein
MPRTRMINESGFDGTCYDDKAVLWHPVSPPALRLAYHRSQNGATDLSRANKFKLREFPKRGNNFPCLKAEATVAQPHVFTSQVSRANERFQSG